MNAVCRFAIPFFFVYFKGTIWKRTLAPLDRILMIAFGAMTLLGLGIAYVCFRKSLRVAGEKDGDLKMFFWALGGMIGLILAGMSAVYILLPIFLHY